MEFSIDEKIYKAHAFDRIAKVVTNRNKDRILLSIEDEQAVIDIVNEVTELFATIARMEQEILEEDIVDADNN